MMSKTVLIEFGRYMSANEKSDFSRFICKNSHQDEKATFVEKKGISIFLIEFWISEKQKLFV